MHEFVVFIATMHTPYMSNQEFLPKYLARATESTQFMSDCGVEVGNCDAYLQRGNGTSIFSSGYNAG